MGSCGGLPAPIDVKDDGYVACALGAFDLDQRFAKASAGCVCALPTSNTRNETKARLACNWFNSSVVSLVYNENHG